MVLATNVVIAEVNSVSMCEAFIKLVVDLRFERVLSTFKEGGTLDSPGFNLG